MQKIHLAVACNNVIIWAQYFFYWMIHLQHTEMLACVKEKNTEVSTKNKRRKGQRISKLITTLSYIGSVQPPDDALLFCVAILEVSRWTEETPAVSTSTFMFAIQFLPL